MNPLQGLGVLVTRPAHQAANLARLIEAAGGEAVLFPTLEIVEMADSAPLCGLIDQLEQFDLAVFVSPNAAEIGLKKIRARRVWPPALKVAAVGQGSARELRRLGVPEVLAPDEGNDSESLLALPQLREVRGWRVLIFRGAGGRETLADGLRQRGARVDYAECYRRQAPHCDIGPLLARWRKEEIGAVTVNSGDGLRHLVAMLGPQAETLLKGTPLFAAHPRIGALAQQLGWETVFSANSGDEGLVERLIEWCNREKQQR
jgi:uroporphyrinogen-III synthase